MPLTFLAGSEDVTRIGEGALASIAEVYDQMYPSLSFAAEIQLVNTREIQGLNQSHRLINEPTDVLSFPTFRNTRALFEVVGIHSTLIGSIVICPERVSSYQETLPQMVHHGLLHLFGYDHETDASSWNTAEKRILKELAKRSLYIPSVSYE